MAATSLSWMFIVLGLLAILGNIAILIFLFTRYGKHPKPTLLAILAFLLMILTTVMHWLANLALPAFFDSETYVLATVVFNFFSTLGHFGAMLLLVAAIYTDRKTGTAVASEERFGRSTLTPENPYSPPENR